MLTKARKERVVLIAEGFGKQRNQRRGRVGVREERLFNVASTLPALKEKKKIVTHHFLTSGELLSETWPPRSSDLAWTASTSPSEFELLHGLQDQHWSEARGELADLL